MADVEVQGLNEVITKLTKVTEGQYIKRGVARIAVEGKEFMAVYPPTRRMPQPFKTPLQQRYFFWALHEGIIVVPYGRGGLGSERLGDRWTVHFVNDGYGAVITNNASYAAWVQKQGQQSFYHEGNWQTDQQGADYLAPRGKDILLEEFRRDMA